MHFHQKPHTYVDHVHLYVENLERSVVYYQEVIGFQVLEQEERIAHLTTDGKRCLLTLEQPEGVSQKQGRTTGLYHFALLLPKRSDLAQIVYHLVRKGIQLGSSDHLVSEALYLNDPDGNGIEIYNDRDPAVWEWHSGQVKMTVDPLDFEDLLRSEKEEPWKGLPAKTLMGHIHLHVSELEKTEEFYTKALGFEVVCRFGGQALFISTGKYHHHIGLNTWNGVGAPKPAPNSGGLRSFTLVYPSEETRRETLTQLRSIGASISEEDGKVVTIDPSGNRIILKI